MGLIGEQNVTNHMGLQNKSSGTIPTGYTCPQMNMRKELLQ